MNASATDGISRKTAAIAFAIAGFILFLAAAFPDRMHNPVMVLPSADVSAKGLVDYEAALPKLQQDKRHRPDMPSAGDGGDPTAIFAALAPDLQSEASGDAKPSDFSRADLPSAGALGARAPPLLA